MHRNDFLSLLEGYRDIDVNVSRGCYQLHDRGCPRGRLQVPKSKVLSNDVTDLPNYLNKKKKKGRPAKTNINRRVHSVRNTETLTNMKWTSISHFGSDS
jgi:hypothetical protein